MATKISSKFDSWQREITSKFASILSESVAALFNSISVERTTLEKKSVDQGPIHDIISAILFVYDSNQKKTDFARDLNLFVDCEKLLRKQRFMFPSNWLYVEGLLGEWSAFQEILGVRN